MLIGTAGHIDHGKTALIGALTGRNTDRLPEEIARGISIELGYAYVPVDACADRTLGFIDVPGHEKFVHTMLAGATGIDFALLVVAADDGVMPQTREHVAILLQLGVTEGVVALNKADAAEPRQRERARAQVAELLAGSPAQHWPVLEVSARTGSGIPALRELLHRHAAMAAARAVHGHFRMAVDRVFTLAGIGTVVTGTVHAGRVAVGDEIALQPGDRRARVRSLHAQDRPAAAGVAGERCALNLVGVEKREVARGMWVQAAALANVSDRIDALLQLGPQEARALPDRAMVHLHHGTEDVLARVSSLEPIVGQGAARIEPGQTHRVALSLARPLASCLGDRFIVRDASATRTVGGGRILDPLAPRRGRRAPRRLALLQALAGVDVPAGCGRAAALQVWLSTDAVPAERVCNAWNLTTGEAETCWREVDARVAAGVVFAGRAWQRLGDKVLAAVAAAHAREPEMPGVEQNRLRRIVAPELSAEAFAERIDELRAAGALLRRGAFLADPAHRAELAADEQRQWERVAPLLQQAQYAPPRVRDIARDTGIAEAAVRDLLRRVARVGHVTLVAQDHFFLTPAVSELADIAARLNAADGSTRAAEFRDRIGTGRKLAIQILEFFDRVGFTRRVRDEHVIRRDNPWRGDPQARDPDRPDDAGVTPDRPATPERATDH
jgi:selenocysteine-specific elongation factor